MLKRHLATGALLLVTLVAGCSLSGCGAEIAAPPTPAPTSTPFPTATVQVGFQVAVSPMPTRAHPGPTAVPPRPQPTRRPGPYLLLIPAKGPPESRTIIVIAGLLPANAQIQLLWSPRAHSVPLETTTYTDRHGAFRARFTVPGTTPGAYSIVAEVNGLRVADATYRVVSTATVAIRVASAGSAPRITVKGRHFLPDLALILVTYPIDRSGKPLLLGSTRSDARGRFVYSRVMRSLRAGQYILRAYSNSATAAQMAEAFFAVEL